MSVTVVFRQPPEVETETKKNTFASGFAEQSRSGLMSGRCCWFHAPRRNCRGPGRELSKGRFISTVSLARYDWLIGDGFVSVASQGGGEWEYFSDAEPRPPVVDLALD